MKSGGGGPVLFLCAPRRAGTLQSEVSRRSRSLDSAASLRSHERKRECVWGGGRVLGLRQEPVIVNLKGFLTDFFRDMYPREARIPHYVTNFLCSRWPPQQARTVWR